MEYRELGNTGLRVSVIGMGCEGFAEDGCKMTKTLFDLAEARGVNYFDLYTSNPDVRRAVGDALAEIGDHGLEDGFVLQERNDVHEVDSLDGEVRIEFQVIFVFFHFWPVKAQI